MPYLENVYPLHRLIFDIAGTAFNFLGGGLPFDDTWRTSQSSTCAAQFRQDWRNPCNTWYGFAMFGTLGTDLGQKTSFLKYIEIVDSKIEKEIVDTIEIVVVVVACTSCV